MNKKGFTLIELIAAIMLLGIILVMVSLNVVKHLEKNKRKIILESAKGYVTVINDNNYINDPDKEISSSTVESINPKIKKQIAGDLPSSGSVTVNATTKKVSSATLVFDKYRVVFNGTKYTISAN